MSEVLAEAARWRSQGTGAGRATVVRALGSSPFRVGSTLVLADDGRIAGSVSAGCVEGAAAAAIAAARAGGYREVIRYGVSDERAAEVGLTCGGIIDLLIEPEVAPEAVAAAAEGRAVAVATLLPVGRETLPTRHVVIDAAGIHSGSLGNPTADECLASLARVALRDGISQTIEVDAREVYIDVVAPRPCLVIVGAGEIAVHLVRLAHAYGFRTVVIDARTAFATRERFPDADDLLIGWADELADRAGIDSEAHVVTLAHDPKFDDPALLVALRRGARYVGALGSRRTHAARLTRLREAGIGPSDLARIHAPVGYDLGRHDPADIALGILAEIVAERNRGASRPPSVRERPLAPARRGPEGAARGRQPRIMRSH